MSSRAPSRFPTEVGDGYVVSLVRAILGLLLFHGALRELLDLGESGYFGDVFHIPIVPEWLVPSRVLFTVLVVVQLALAFLVAAGRSPRPALFATSLIGLFLLMCDRSRYHNNRYALFLFAFLLAFAPCDRAFTFGRRPPADRNGPLWAQRLATVQLAMIYIGSGGSKFLDPDWRSGLVIGDRLAQSTALAVSKGVPAGVVGFLSSPEVAGALSKLAIGTELFLAVALFAPRLRFFALWWGVMFHLTIEVTSKVEIFTWLTFAIYALFARPALRERTLLYDARRPLAVLVARAVRFLDWLARFEVRAAETREHGVVVVDRDGSSATGIAAAARLARALPLLFPASVPLFVIAWPWSRGALRAKPA
jgi:hypothetical protein